MNRERWDRKSWPSWLQRIERAGEKDDRRGIDFIAHAQDVGKIYIQIKTTYAGIRKYLRQYADREEPVCIVIIGEEEQIMSVFQKTIEALTLSRQQAIKGNRPRFTVIS